MSLALEKSHTDVFNPLEPNKGFGAIDNVCNILNPDGPISGDFRNKAFEVSGRLGWLMRDGVLVVPRHNPEFDDYRAAWGNEPTILVPEELDYGAYTIRDAFNDPRVRAAVRGRAVTSYSPDQALGRLIEESGGRYLWDNTEVIEYVNDKSHFAEISDGQVAVPHGSLAHGLSGIAAAVRTRLVRGQDTFVRLCVSGGGLGNHSFNASDGVPTLAELEVVLGGDNPNVWRKGKALVEDFVPGLRHFPSVAYQAKPQDGLLYHGLQLTRGGNCLGCVLPTPPWIEGSEELGDLGDFFGAQLYERGYRGTANTDLGTTVNGQTYGFEINGRLTATAHAANLQQRTGAEVVVAVDKVVLRSMATFRELRNVLAANNLLARPDNPYGVIITIPPDDHAPVAGIQINGHNYSQAWDQLQQVLSLMGKSGGNTFDNSIFEDRV